MSKKNNKRCRKSLRCVECDSSSFYYDGKLKEVSCLGCGLVLVAPYSPDFVTDGYRIVCDKRKS